jgi:hypothetical protein
MMQSEEYRMHWCKGELRSLWTIRRKRMASAIADILRRGVKEGAIRQDVPAEVLAGFLLGMLRMHARDLAEARGVSRSLGIVVDLFLRGAGGTAQRSEAVARPVPATTANRGYPT